jgi:hypothetical protein
VPVNACADILVLMLHSNMGHADVLVVHSAAASFVDAVARAPGATAVDREVHKCNLYRQRGVAHATWCHSP